MTRPAAFELHHARVALDSKVVVDDVDFKLETGEFLALLGANGSGKTTLVRAMLGLVAVADGEAQVFGEAVASFCDWFRIAYVPQRVTADPGGPASVMEVVLSGRIARSTRFRRYGGADRASAREALELVGLAAEAGRSITRLSGGQQQRALIARALAGDPDVLVLDEPLSGVDVEHQERVASALTDFHRAGKTVLLVAHGLGPVEDLVTREVVMEAGRVVYDGPHHPDHVHAEHIHHPEPNVAPSPLDRAAGGR